MNNHAILIIDDEKAQRNILSGYLKKKGFQVYCANSGSEAIKIIKKELIEIILSDYKLPGMSGLEILSKVPQINPEIVFVMITAYGSIENAVNAMHLGAYDYLTKPINLDELDLLIKRIIDHKLLKFENERLKKQINDNNKKAAFISQSAKMEQSLSIAYRAADSKATILITGENGTGKEVLAKSIHNISNRKDYPFIHVNIPGLPESLLENELFGHERFAYTGAGKMFKGRFEVADKGTIFLDEIGDIPPSIQVKLLNVLQNQRFERIGGTESIKVDVRIIAATNQDIRKKIKDNLFREDLFYRLNVIGVNILPLRERKEDILPLIDFFIQKYSQENNRIGIRISKEALDNLLKYNYPGNVRELENIIERAVVLARTNIIMTSDLPITLNDAIYEERLLEPVIGPLKKQLEELEKKLIFDALKKCSGNQTKAGDMLGISERNLRYKLTKHNIKIKKYFS